MTQSMQQGIAGRVILGLKTSQLIQLTSHMQASLLQSCIYPAPTPLLQYLLGLIWYVLNGVYVLYFTIYKLDDIVFLLKSFLP